MEEPTLSEYQSSFHASVAPVRRALEPYEALVAERINAEPEDNTETPITNRYEELVARKMKETSPVKEPEQTPPVISANDNSTQDTPQMQTDHFASSGLHKHTRTTVNQPNNSDSIDNNSAPSRASSKASSRTSSRASSRSSHATGQPRKTYKTAQQQPRTTEPPQAVTERPRTTTQPRATKTTRAERSQESPRTPERQLRPVFFKDPSEASEEQQNDLYGPFWVSTRPNTKMPNRYAELAAILQ